MTLTRTRLTATLAATATAALLVATAAPASASVEGPTWNHAAHHWPSVSVEDHTGTMWPVTASTRAWGSGLHYRACGTSNQCIRVTEKYLGKNGTVAYTSLAWYGHSDGTSSFAPLTIVLNKSYGVSMSYSKREQVVKHELGHALGLGHDRTRDVMNDDGVHSYNVISSYNRTDLHNLYIR